LYEFSGLKEFPEIDINLAGTLIRMKNNKILDLFTVHPEVADLVSSSGNAGPDKIQLTGLSGSAKALTVAAAFRKSQNTHLVVLAEKEEASYFYNDLTGLTDDESIFFFPSTYKRSVQYEQTEPANIILRTEVLNHLTSGKRKSIIVSYPESLMEKVVSRQTLKRNTFTISKGDRISLEFLEEILHEYKFERVDFVYDPGQYSVRGSIADVFSFSADMPYRIDFFGEEVETIRSFNIDDQLSVDIFNHILFLNRLPSGLRMHLS
jgi:transcription-repair coupling factor (superfamily II helicase)